MIYFDNSATSLQKPPQVAQAAAWAINHLGNAGRSFHQPALLAARAVHAARAELATLVKLGDPLRVAFTSSATEALNLVALGMLGPQDAVITTVLEHNSVLRPLRLAGCHVDFAPCDEQGNLLADKLEPLLKPNTKAVFCTHGSNLTGGLTPLEALRHFCQKHSLVLVADAAQSIGHTAVQASDADILCFAGHKGLMGPQGTGGVIAQNLPPMRAAKSGGTGNNSFNLNPPTQMPDIFEAGTANAHALCGLQKGVEFINQTGVEAIARHCRTLTEQFLQGVAAIGGAVVYGSQTAKYRLPVVSLNIGDLPSEETALLLWQNYQIATRPGAHCAPLAHRHFGTEGRGMVRFSFGYYNTAEEIDTAVEALQSIAAGRG